MPDRILVDKLDIAGHNTDSRSYLRPNTMFLPEYALDELLHCYRRQGGSNPVQANIIREHGGSKGAK